MKNKYMVHSRISEKKFREILKYFCLDLEAKKIAEICKISRPCVNRILREIRILIAKECEKISKMSGEIEVDESYFGAKRVRGKRGRGAGKKTPVFGMLKCNRTSLYASRQTLLCQRIAVHNKGIFRVGRK